MSCMQYIWCQTYFRSLLARNFLVICCNFLSIWVVLYLHFKWCICHHLKKLLANRVLSLKGSYTSRYVLGSSHSGFFSDQLLLGDLIMLTILVTRVSLSGVRFPSVAVLYVVLRIIVALSFLYVTFAVWSAFFFRWSTHLSLFITDLLNWPFIFLAQLRILSIEMFDPVLQCIALSCAI